MTKTGSPTRHYLAVMVIGNLSFKRFYGTTVSSFSLFTLWLWDEQFLPCHMVHCQKPWSNASMAKHFPNCAKWAFPLISCYPRWWTSDSDNPALSSATTHRAVCSPLLATFIPLPAPRNHQTPTKLPAPLSPSFSQITTEKSKQLLRKTECSSLLLW